MFPPEPELALLPPDEALLLPPFGDPPLYDVLAAEAAAAAEFEPNALPQTAE